MDISSYVLLSHEQALRRRMDVAANNMANMATGGFRREAPLFREYVERGRQALVPEARATSFVLDYGAVHDTTPGAFTRTDGRLDLMIEGPGYLAVERAGGGTAYTRAGSLKVLDTGELATARGERILGEGGQPITVPEEQWASVEIGADGTVEGTDGPLGRIAVTVFDDEAGLRAEGDGLMSGDGAGVAGRELAAAETRLRTGGIEGSNVQAVAETTSMVEILRAYQASMRMSEAINDMRGRAIERLGRVE